MHDKLIKVAYEESRNGGKAISREIAEFICEDYFSAQKALATQIEVNVRLAKENAELREKLGTGDINPDSISGVPV